MSRPTTPAGGAQMNSRPASHYGSEIPGVANIDHMTKDGASMSGGLRDNTAVQDGGSGLQRSNSQMSQSATYVPSRGGTLKKKASLHRGTSLKRNGSRRSSYAGSVKSLRVGEKEKYEPEEYNSAFYCPVPTSGSPTDLLANRFQAWRKVLKDLITYFKDLHKSYDTRSKTLLSASNVINNTAMPADFLQNAGIGEAAIILRNFHKQALNEAHKARDLENEVIMQLTGLRSDLSQKIKEIKSLSGDFKNSVGKEQENTKKAVNAFQESLGMVDRDASATAGKGDPFIQKLAVERQLERQVEEENYLHRAYLNLEASGRELESIVIGEIQKAYTVLTGILKREADDNYDAAEKLREGPLAMSKDHEWDAFVTDNHHMVDPRQPLRQVRQISYPGKNHASALEVRNGMLERKSKYLKNYTPGWYILSPTHLHEFKSADRIAFQQPIMSLYLPEQKIGSHSEPGSSSNKFMLKGRQAGSMHRGHTWIFRAESHDTMMAWYADIKELTEVKGEARNEFVRRTHARSFSGTSVRAPSVSSGGSQMEEDEADQVAFSSEQSVRGVPVDSMPEDAGFAAGGAALGASAGKAAVATDDARSEAGWRPPQQRPQPGGRFPSEVNVTRGLQSPLSRSSGDSSDEQDRDALAQAGALPGSGVPFVAGGLINQPHTDLQQPMSKNETAGAASVPQTQLQPQTTSYTAGEHAHVVPQATGAEVAHDSQSQYREWVGTMEAGVAGAAVGAGATHAYNKHQQDRSLIENSEQQKTGDLEAMPSLGYSSTPIAVNDERVDASNHSTAADVPTRNVTAGPSIHNAATLPYAAESIQPVKASQAQQSANDTLISGTDIRTGGTGISAGSQQPVLSTTTSFSTMDTTNATVGDTAGDLGGLNSPLRPSPISHKSVQTISDLHIPGEFPRMDSRGNIKSP